MPRPAAWAAQIEPWLEAERDQIGLWLPVMLGCGIGLYFGLGQAWMWAAAMALLGGVGAGSLAIGRGGRGARVIGWAALVAMLGIGLAWGRSVEVAAPVLARPMVTDVAGTVIEADRLPAREQVRLLVAPDAGSGLPPQVRLSIDEENAPPGWSRARGFRPARDWCPRQRRRCRAPMISRASRGSSGSVRRARRWAR